MRIRDRIALTVFVAGAVLCAFAVATGLANLRAMRSSAEHVAAARRACRLPPEVARMAAWLDSVRAGPIETRTTEDGP